ncbi:MULTISPECIES: carbohydrate ABC transporter permease [Streptomyces]|uniref:L-arabinose transport system permease protein AraQ n=2 Tax=Streptomyces TaxID=1883 RepID=A0A1D8FVX6_9ACTN|nr:MULTISPECIES: carbohydrate ABC transporter permease [Streptomyces]AOT57351.1 L-arabinose transport system permease protein AraQ [Streptomyces rubrolavendulae]OSY48989.1 L-arabinose transport system permease protein AraQ [Streptomyces fradiae ATCC 10745 = DSM 40063]QEV10793.1 carbohydrate ABC transporter permease [Streptomyces fradiae ATCC 10745 = DSM 40063]
MRRKRRGGRAAPSRPVWEEEPRRAGLAAKGIVLAGACLAILFPLWIVVVTSLSSRRTIDEAGGLVVVPRDITFVAYQELLGGGQVQRAALVSVGVTVVGTLFSMAVSVLCAHGLSRPGSAGHRWILMTLLATMFFGAGLIPTYLLVQALGLTDTYLALILPSAVSVFNILVLRAFFMNISPELIDSARIDGAGELRILWRIVIPLSRAVLAVIALFYAVGYWSAWFNASLYLSDQDMMPLQNVMIQIVQKQEPPTGLAQMVRTGQLSPLAVQMAVMVLALVPVAVASPFVQKHFRKGMLTGAVKG